MKQKYILIDYTHKNITRTFTLTFNLCKTVEDAEKVLDNLKKTNEITVVNDLVYFTTEDKDVLCFQLEPQEGETTEELLESVKENAYVVGTLIASVDLRVPFLQQIKKFARWILTR